MKIIEEKQEGFLTDDFFKAKAQVCVTKQTKYRKLRKAVSKEERYLAAFLKQCKLMQIPPVKLDRFEELYKSAFSRISMIRKAKRKEFNGKVRFAGETNQFVGPSMSRFIQYLAEEDPVEISEEFVTVLKELKSRVCTRIDTDFARDSFTIMDYVRQGEDLYLRDITTFNVINLKHLSKIVQEADLKGFYKTLNGSPWLKCSENTSKWIYKFCVDKLIKMWEKELCMTLPKILHLGKQAKVPYFRFQLSTDAANDNKWHTCETRALAELVAKQFKAEITKIEEVEPNKFKAIEIKDATGAVLEAYPKYDGDWVDEDSTSLE